MDELKSWCFSIIKDNTKANVLFDLLKTKFGYDRREDLKATSVNELNKLSKELINYNFFIKAHLMKLKDNNYENNTNTYNEIILLHKEKRHKIEANKSNLFKCKYNYNYNEH
eukprot:333558_1